MERSTILELPYLMPSQAQKHVTHNEALTMLDALVQVSVATRALSSPPASPPPGGRYIVADDADGAWVGREGRLAAWQDGAWSFFQPLAGWLAYAADEERLLLFTGQGWQEAGGALLPDRLGINATAQAPNRLALAGAASLFTHEGAGHQLKINKAEDTDTASLLFQTGYSGRAEFGLAGDDDFHVKVSADGASWAEAVVIDRATGHTSFPAGIAGVREQLTAERTYYVDPAGSDDNDGLSAASAFATIQKAVDEAGKLDCSIHDVTIRLADGAHSGTVNIKRPLFGGGTLFFIGNGTTPANVTVPGFSIEAATVNISGVKLATTTDWIDSINARNGAAVTTGALVFGNIGANAYHINASTSASVTIGADYTVNGGALRHWGVSGGGRIAASARHVTLAGTSDFSIFASSTTCGVIQLWDQSFAGTATGRRYSITTNGVIYTYGEAESFLPGDTAGTTASGGVYG